MHNLIHSEFNIFMLALQGAGLPQPVRAVHFYHSIRYCVWIYQQQQIYLTENNMLCYGPLVSELGRGGRVHGAPQPRMVSAVMSMNTGAKTVVRTVYGNR